MTPLGWLGSKTSNQTKHWYCRYKISHFIFASVSVTWKQPVSMRRDDGQCTKRAPSNLQTVQARISLHICTGWSGLSLSAYRINGYCSICQWTENTQIRLNGCACWAESSLFAYDISALFPRCASYDTGTTVHSCYRHLLSQITTYLVNLVPVLTWKQLVTKYCRKEEKLLLRSSFSSYTQYFQYISNIRSQITCSFVKCGCWTIFSQFCKSDMSRYGYHEELERESTVIILLSPIPLDPNERQS